MSKTKTLLGLRTNWFFPVLVACAACTGVASLPGNSSGPSDGVGATSGIGTTGNAGVGSTPTGNAGTGTSSGPVTPTTVLDSGRVVLRRLNAAEYNNTVRDLLGTTKTPGDKFPVNVADGFDTIGLSLSFSELLAEGLEGAVGDLIGELLARPVGDPQRARVLVCEPTATNFATCVPQILTGFLKNAFRRPATPAEVQDLTDLASSVRQSTGDVVQGVSAALEDALLSPNFLFRVELGDAHSPAASRLNDYELASRLSYFIWSTMPDQTLLQAADSAKLTAGGADFDAQVSRMLADPKASEFVRRFGGQWLSMQDVDGIDPDMALFPSLDEALRSSIAQETTLFFGSLVGAGQPLKTLLLADFSYVNAPLAKQYGLTPPTGTTGFAKTSLQGSPRIGLLTQDTFLTTTSQPDRTSPVKRGNWVLEHLLCDPPPAPPPGVLPLVTPAPNSGVTVRTVLEAHRANPYCASCHKVMDPIGLGLENFDAIGSYRTTDNGQSIDASGQMPDGTTFSGAAQLAKIIADDPRFPACVAQQLLTYSIGRAFAAPDGRGYAAGIGVPLASGTWTDILHAIVKSEAFLTRRGEAS